MKKRAILPILALGFVGASTAAAVAFLASNDWFGKGDLRSFWIWTAMLSVPVVIIAMISGRLLAKLNPVVAIVPSAAIGAALGYGSTVVVWKMLGPWFGAFSFPVLYCWIAGAICACFIATALGRRGPNKSPDRTPPSGVGQL